MIVKLWNFSNVGDQLNKFLINSITETDKHEYVHANLCTNQDNYMAVGSILQFADKDTIVWGSGFLNFNYCFDRCVPKKICAVRGPFTRILVNKLGIECPEIYGDPALLLPKYYQPKTTKKYKLGVILHWSDEIIEAANWIPQLESNISTIRINHNLNYNEFIDCINSCEYIASSSLHGIILADAYNIPAIQISIRDRDDQFKFYDYFATVNRPLIKPIFTEKLETKYLLSKFYNYNLKINTDPLWEVCPFKKGGIK